MRRDRNEATALEGGCSIGPTIRWHSGDWRMTEWPSNWWEEILNCRRKETLDLFRSRFSIKRYNRSWNSELENWVGISKIKYWNRARGSNCPSNQKIHYSRNHAQITHCRQRSTFGRRVIVLSFPYGVPHLLIEIRIVNWPKIYRMFTKKSWKKSEKKRLWRFRKITVVQFMLMARRKQ